MARDYEGYVYFIYCKANDRFRIGWSERNPDGRFDLTNMYASEGVEKFALMHGSLSDEQALHFRFREHWHKGEWFRGHESIREYIRENAHPWYDLLLEDLKKEMASFDIPGPPVGPPDGKKIRSISRKLRQVASESKKQGRPPKIGPKKRGRPPKTPSVVVKPTHRTSRYAPLLALLDRLAADEEPAP